MKKKLLLQCFIGLLWVSSSQTILAEQELQLGDTKEQVISTLGKPKGIMKSGESEFLSYQRGIIRITDGKVTMIKLETKEEAMQKEAERKAIEAERQIAERIQQQAKEKRIQEGTLIKNKKRADRKFATLPDEDKLNFWKDFQSKYPEVNVDNEIAPLKKAVEPEQPTPETTTPPETPQMSEREQLLETINTKQEELDAMIEKAKTTSSGRTARVHYLRNRKSLEDELTELRAKLKTLPVLAEKN